MQTLHYRYIPFVSLQTKTSTFRLLYNTLQTMSRKNFSTFFRVTAQRPGGSGALPPLDASPDLRPRGHSPLRWEGSSATSYGSPSQWVRAPGKQSSRLHERFARPPLGVTVVRVPGEQSSGLFSARTGRQAPEICLQSRLRGTLSCNFFDPYAIL